MRWSALFLTSATVAVFALAAGPAEAQHRGGGHGGGSAGHAVSRGAAPRANVASGARIAPRGGGGRVGPARIVGPRVGVVGSRGFASRPAFASRGFVGSRAAFASRAVIGARGFGGPRGFATRFVGPRIIVSPYRFSRPFYAFRPRFSLGFGLWVGFPVAYPYYYGYPYGYDPYAYGYPYPYPYASAYPYGYPASPYGYASTYGYPAAGYPAGSYPSQSYPSQSYPSQNYPSQNYPPQNYPVAGADGAQQMPDSGGVSFEITPSTARVYVDGTEVGSVAEFSPTAMPLTLTPGRHHIELRVAGYHTMSFDADVIAGQVIPYRGDMQPQR